MSDQVRPEVKVVLDRARRLQSLANDEVTRFDTETVTAVDDARTVEVTLDRRHRATIAVYDLAADQDTLRHRVASAHRAAADAAEAARRIADARIDAALTEIMRTGGDDPRSDR